MRSWTAVLDDLLISLPAAGRLAVIAAVILLMAFIARKKRLLTSGGTAAAAVLGIVIFYTGGVSGFVMLLFFFLSSSIAGRLLSSGTAERIAAKGNERDMMQVAANGLPAAIALILFRLSPYPAAFLAAFAAAVAEAEADTFSGEIGRLSHRDPVSIITFTRVPKGLSGGVTVLGLVSGAASSLLIALLFMGTFGCTVSAFSAVAASGFLGSVLDSFLGAALQVQYRRKDGTLTERAVENGERNERARGIAWLDNDMVNLISGLFSASIASVIVMLG